MPDTRRYSNKRFLIRYEDAIDESYCVLWVVPIGIARIMQGLLSSRGLWRSSYVKSYFAGYYQLPDFTEWHELSDKIRAFLGGISMSDFCLSTLIEKLENIAQAIQAQADCCQNQTNGLRVVEDGTGGFYYGSQDPIDKPDTFGPAEEFETEAEFNAHLCSAANNIISGLILSLNNWSVISFAALVAGSIITGVFIANPPIGVVLALAVAAVGLGVLASLSSHIDTNRQEWVCAVYNAGGYADMLVRIDQLINDMVIALDIGLLEVPITDLIHSVLDTDTLNKAYTSIGLPPPLSPIDCANCLADCTIELQTGSLSSGDLSGNPGSQFVASSGPIQDSDGVTRHYVIFRLADNQDCCRQISSTLSGYTSPCSNPLSISAFRNTSWDGTITYNELECPAVPEVVDECLKRAVFRSESAFTITVDVGSMCQCPSQ